MKKVRIKAQPFDCMQYFYSSVQEPLIRTMISLNGHMNEVLFKNAVQMSINAIPVIGCCFDKINHVWEKRIFTSDDIVHVIEVQERDKNPAEKLLLSSIDIQHEPQLKIFLVRNADSDTLCIIINHMISDGGGFKEYLYLLAELYSQLERGTHISAKSLKCGKRNLNQLLKNFSLKEKLHIMFSKPPINSHKSDPLLMPLKGDKANQFISICHLSKQQFYRIKVFARTNNTSINNIFLAAYIYTLHKVTGCTHISVPCPVDLRKYKKPGQTCGICNLTGNYFCDVTVNSDSTFTSILSKVSSQMKANKESTACLKGPMLFHMMFHALPFNLVRKLFYKISPVPVTSYTNLGIIDSDKLRFGKLSADNAFISTAVKYVPYFQLSVSTYKDCCALTSSLHGTEEDRKIVDSFLHNIENEFDNL